MVAEKQTEMIAAKGDKAVREGRIIIIILSVLVAIAAVAEYFMYGEDPIILAVYAPFILAFVAFAIFYYRNPFALSIAALSVYGFMQIAGALADPTNLAKGIIIKVIIIAGLIKAIKSARDFRVRNKNEQKTGSDILDQDF
ncbi:MAG TPA: hypothetical protein DEP18_00820 [Flavobacteriales bacterium]|nr:hypothetical protein [Flavobacteriales bacterium]